MTAVALLKAHKAALETMLEMNAKARVDRPGRFILDGLDRQGTRYLRKIEGELRRGPHAGIFGALGAFGSNGHGPTIDLIIRQAEFHRATGATARPAPEMRISQMEEVS